MFAQDFSLEKLLVRRAIARGDQGLDLVSIFADNLPHGVWRLVGRSQTHVMDIPECVVLSTSAQRLTLGHWTYE